MEEEEGDGGGGGGRNREKERERERNGAVRSIPSATEVAAAAAVAARSQHPDPSATTSTTRARVRRPNIRHITFKGHNGSRFFFHRTVNEKVKEINLMTCIAFCHLLLLFFLEVILLLASPFFISQFPCRLRVFAFHLLPHFHENNLSWYCPKYIFSSNFPA